jgi:hypothetical protein
MANITDITAAPDLLFTIVLLGLGFRLSAARQGTPVSFGPMLSFCVSSFNTPSVLMCNDLYQISVTPMVLRYQ